MSFRVLIAEDFTPWASFLQSLVSADPSFEVIDVVSDGQAGMRAAEELKPDLILVDVGLPGLNGIDLARGVQQIVPKPLVLFVSQHSTPAIVKGALDTGALGYVLKLDATADLIKAIEAVRRGEKFLSTSIRNIALGG